LFGDDVIEFEFPSLDIKPTRAKEIAEAHIGGFKMKRTVVLRSRHKQKADVLSERPGGENVQAPNVKTMGGQPALGGGAGWERVGMACTLPVGIGNAEAEGTAMERKSQPYTAMNAAAATRCFFNFRTSCNIAPPRPRFRINSQTMCNVTRQNRTERTPTGEPVFQFLTGSRPFSEKICMAPCRFSY